MSKKKIEKNIPIPEFRKRSEYYYLILKMKKGDSIFFENIKEANKFYNCTSNSKKFSHMTFVRRTFDNGTRIWRTE